jgi:hypothetical protein
LHAFSLLYVHRASPAVFKKISKTLGPLRMFLAVITVVLVALAPFSLEEASYLDWGMVPTVLAPIVTVMMLFVLPLDIMMARLFMVGGDDPVERKRMGSVIGIELALFGVLVASWVPFMRALVPD